MKTSMLWHSYGMLFLLFFFFFQNNGFGANYRSAQSGDWHVLATWEILTTGWTSASELPDLDDNVEIQAGHAISIMTDDAFAGSIMVPQGATLQLLGASYALTLGNGLSGADLVVEGVLHDNANSGGGNGVFFVNGGTWRLGSAATVLKTNNSSAARYRDHYEGGMANIPPTANWVIRYLGTGNPSFTSIDVYYPNLIFESFSGHWAPAIGASRFQGIHGTAIVLGNLDIGGGGTGSVTIINQNTNGSPVRIKGSAIIRAGNTLTNAGNVPGTGFAFESALIVEGTLDASAGSGRVTFDGLSQQVVSGNGTLSIRDMDLNNPSGLGLLRPVEVLGQLLLLGGNLTLNTFDLTVYGGIFGGGPDTYVRTNVPGGGQLVQPLTGSTEFPIGNNTFNRALLSGGSGLLGMRLEDRVLSEGLSGSQLSAQIINRSWMIDNPSGVGFGVLVEWDAFAEMPGFERESCYFSEIIAGGWMQQVSQSASGNDPYWMSTVINGQSQGFSIASGGALPVELIYFEANVLTEGVALAWETALELGSDRFEIERKAAGENFERIAIVKAAGFSEKRTAYRFLDDNPPAGKVYYRLRQFDQDGTFTYSNIAYAYGDFGEEIGSCETLFRNNFRLEASTISSSLNVMITNGQGFLEKTQLEPGELLWLDSSHWPAGLYLVWMGTVDGRWICRKAMKQ